VAYNNPTDSFLALDFSTPTTDTVNFANGLMASRYYVRARVAPEPMVTSWTGWSAMFSLDLLVKDPRRYIQAALSVTGTGTAANTLATTVSWPLVTITASGAGSATYSVANTTLSKTLTLNLSGLVNTNVVVVDMAKAKITKNGVETPSLYVSGNYWPIQPGNNTITVTNGTNMTTVTSWRVAFVL
jgi:phage-related protein